MTAVVAYGEPLIAYEDAIAGSLYSVTSRVDCAACGLLVLGILSVPSLAGILAVFAACSIKCCSSGASYEERILNGIPCFRTCCLCITVLVAVESLAVIILTISGSTGLVVNYDCTDASGEVEQCAITIRWWTMLLPQLALLMVASFGTKHAQAALRLARLAGHRAGA